VAAEARVNTAEAGLEQREAGRRLAAKHLREALQRGRRLRWAPAASRRYHAALRGYQRVARGAAVSREAVALAKGEKLTACRA
jgi:hypothetical protein